MTLLSSTASITAFTMPPSWATGIASVVAAVATTTIPVPRVSATLLRSALGSCGESATHPFGPNHQIAENAEFAARRFKLSLSRPDQPSRLAPAGTERMRNRLA